MKTLLQHLNEVSEEKWCGSFKEAAGHARACIIESIIEEAGKRYAAAVAKKALENAAKNATVVATKGDRSENLKAVYPHANGWEVKVNKPSITDEKNIELR